MIEERTDHVRLDLNRRQLLTAMGATAAALRIPTPFGLLSPTQAKAQDAPLAVLSPAEATTLDALGDVLLPGAAKAGISHYVDAQLAKAIPFLIYRYLDVPIPPTDFYKGSLAALDAYSQAKHRSAFTALTPDVQAAVVGDLAGGKPDGWSGPPPSLVYFVVRMDAVDVVYGTEEGFARLGLEYEAHIAPPQKW
ncbi:MAG: gluconate 2-dehydrogenase subunit 3 family protein [Thermomicrobiales bacterium]